MKGKVTFRIVKLVLQKNFFTFVDVIPNSHLLDLRFVKFSYKTETPLSVLFFRLGDTYFFTVCYHKNPLLEK